MAHWRRFGTTALVVAAQFLGVWLLVSTLTGARRGDLVADQRRDGVITLPPPVMPATTSSTLAALPALSTTTTQPATTTSSPPTTSAPTTTTTVRLRPPTTAPSTTTTAPPPACSTSVGQPAAVVARAGAAWVSGRSDPGRPAVQVSADGGRTWSSVCLPLTGQGAVNGVARHGAGRAWVVGSSANTAFAAHTVDGGVTWTLAQLPDGLVALKDVVFVDAERGWAVGSLSGSEKDGGAIVATIDGGTTWRYQSLPVDAGLSAVDFADARHGLVTGVARAGPVILATTDGGARWSVASLPEQVAPTSRLRDVASLGDQGFAVGDAGILATFDGGATWELRMAEDCCLWGVFFLDPEHGWAVGGGSHGQVYRTSNGGWTWERLATTGGPSLQSVSFADAQRGFAVSHHQSCLYATEDGGTTWTGRRLDGGGPCPA